MIIIIIIINKLVSFDPAMHFLQMNNIGAKHIILTKVQILPFLPIETKAAVLKETEPVTNVLKNPSKVIVLRVSIAPKKCSSIFMREM